MRILLSAVLATCTVALLAGAAPPPPKVPTAPPPPGVPGNIKLTGGGVPDLLARIKLSALVARGHVTAPVPGSDFDFKVHVDEWLKGHGPNDIVVDFGQQRAITPPEHAELLFLGAAAVRDGGPQADLRAVTGPAERYEVPDAQTGLLDTAVKDALAGAPEDKVLSELVQLPKTFSEGAAARMALRSNTDPTALQAADVAVQAPGTNEDARLMLVNTVGGHLPLATLAGLSRGANDERVRIAAVEALGRLAANQPDQRAAAIAAIQPAAQDKNPHLELAAGVALAEAGQAEALAPLNAILAGKDQDLRGEAVRALAELARHGNAEAYDKLESLQSDSNKEVSGRAKAMLGGMGAKPATARPPGMTFAVASAVLIAIFIVALAVMRRRKRG